MKKATLCIEALGVQCPHCHEPVGNPKNGSHLWLPEEIVNYSTSKVKECDSCGESFEIPQVELVELTSPPPPPR